MTWDGEQEAQLSTTASVASCCFGGSQALCETLGVRHRTHATALSSATGLRGDGPGLATNFVRGKRSSTDSFCYFTCTKVSRTGRAHGSHRNQNTLQSHAELLNDLCRLMAVPGRRREQLCCLQETLCSEDLVAAGYF